MVKRRSRPLELYIKPNKKDKKKRLLIMLIDSKIEPPAFLNKDFFKAALEDGLYERLVELKQIVFDDSNGGGENYCSKIYRVKTIYRVSNKRFDQVRSLIVKSITITPATQFLEDLAVFFREKIFYFDVIGKLELLIADDSKFGAKCLYATKEPLQTIVFDDLAQYGYKLASRQNGLNEEHCTVLLKKLAKLHASSMVLLQRDSSIRQHFETGMLDENYVRSNKRFKEFTTLLLRTLADLVKTWDGYEIISEKLHRHCDNLIENLVKTGKVLPDELTVLNHGDLWVNNFLFKYGGYEARKPVDALFVDFQNSFFGSPGCDINFFLNSSVQLDVLVNRRHILIESYYETLRQSLTKMHYGNVPSLEDIKREIHSHELYGFFASYAFLPMVAMKKEDSQDNSIEAFANQEFAAKKVKIMFASNPRTTNTLKYTLKRFDELKIFD